MKIAINRMALDGKLPQGDSRWAQLNDSFVNQDITTLDFANAVYCGHPFAAWHNGRRCHENFVLGQHIAVDMDTEDKRSSIDHLLRLDFVRVYGGLIYTTPSHTPTSPRCRLLFFLDQPITTAPAYKAAIGFVNSLFDGADAACVDASRFLYGSKDCQVEWLDNTLPLEHLRSYYRIHHQKQASPRREYQATPNTPATVERLVNWAIDDSRSQHRNPRGYRLFRQLREQGVSQFDAELVGLRYQQAVQNNGPHPYTEGEMRKSLQSAYRGITH